MIGPLAEAKMVTKKRTAGSVAARVTRYSRDLTIEIEKAEAAIEKAAGSVTQLTGDVKADVRPSKDVTAALRTARRALKKLRALVSRHSRDL